MKNPTHPSLNKVVNPHLARLALHAARPQGEFRVIVHLAHPAKPPRYMKVTGMASPGGLKARIPCNQIERVDKDSNVLSVELREHVI
ncbi:MAG: hypothetical protein AB7H77_04440 [Bdellovibrionales bacterium]